MIQIIEALDANLQKLDTQIAKARAVSEQQAFEAHFPFTHQTINAVNNTYKTINNNRAGYRRAV